MVVVDEDMCGGKMTLDSENAVAVACWGAYGSRGEERLEPAGQRSAARLDNFQERNGARRQPLTSSAVGERREGSSY